ncbi:MAG: cyclase family protein [Candidatus Dadabacteria bacterium]|nr:cyclase family protein [Candidatus Dadabacteria bacterium]
MARAKPNKSKKSSLPTSGWIDISVPLSDGMVHWPDDPDIEIKKVLNIKNGDECNLTHVSMAVHAGTHMDAPCHFRRSGTSIDKMPLSAAIGKARVIEITNDEFIHVEEIRPHRIRKGERLLFKTKNSKSRWDNKPFNKNFVHLSIEAAKFLAERKVQTIGIDYLSIGGYGGNVIEVHEIILKAGIWVIEGLDLSKIESGNYDLICLPIKIAGSDGAPARALVRPI